MSDTTYILIIFVGFVWVLAVLIYRVLTGRGHAKMRKRRNDGEAHRTAQNLKNELEEEENDVVANPAYSSLKTNLFHKDRYED